jgi:Carboxypeptidase regulatory-like domain
MGHRLYSRAFRAPGRRAASLLLAGALAVAGLIGVPGAATADPTSGQMTGLLTDAATQAPLAGLCVVYADPDDLSVQRGHACSDAGGAYTMDGVRPGRWVLVVSDDGGVYAGQASAPVDIVAGQILTRSFQLSVGGGVAGRVVDRVTGEPLPGICPSVFLGRTGTSAPGQVQTCSDGDGAWSVRALPAGVPVTLELGGDRTHAPLWAPDAAARRAARLYTVRAGRSTAVGRLTLHHGAELTGRITTRDGAPVVDAVVEVGTPTTRCGTPCGPRSARTDANGRYRITNIEPQRELVRVSGPRQLAFTFSPGVTNPELGRKLSFGFDRHLTFDATMRPAAHLHVTATGPGDVGMSLDAFTPGGVGVGYHTDLSGDARDDTLDSLPGGPVKLRLVYYGAVHKELWYGGATIEQATPITLVPGRTTEITVDATGPSR